MNEYSATIPPGNGLSGTFHEHYISYAVHLTLVWLVMQLHLDKIPKLSVICMGLDLPQLHVFEYLLCSWQHYFGRLWEF